MDNVVTAQFPGLGLLHGRWAEPAVGRIMPSGSALIGTVQFVPDDGSPHFAVIVVSLPFNGMHRYQRAAYAGHLRAAGHREPDGGWENALLGGNFEAEWMDGERLGARIRADLVGRETWLLSDVVQGPASSAKGPAQYVRRLSLTAKDVLWQRCVEPPDFGDFGIICRYEPGNATVYDLALLRGTRGVVFAWVNATGGGRSMRLPSIREYQDTEGVSHAETFRVPEMNYLREKLGGPSDSDIEAIQGFLHLAIAFFADGGT